MSDDDPTHAPAPDEREYWLDQPANVNLLIRILIVWQSKRIP